MLLMIYKFYKNLFFFWGGGGGELPKIFEYLVVNVKITIILTNLFNEKEGP